MTSYTLNNNNYELVMQLIMIALDFSGGNVASLESPKRMTDMFIGEASHLIYFVTSFCNTIFQTNFILLK